MPVTPFHFGIGALANGVAPSRVSLAAFIAAQVVIDCETAYLRPFVDHNPLLGVMGLGALHMLCVLAGVVGIGLITLRRTNGHGHGNGVYDRGTHHGN